MKCKCCGASVTLEEEFCPYCGALNEPARAHIEAMKQYNRDYQNTRAAVLQNAERQSKRHSRVLILGLLIFLNILLPVCMANSYEIADFLRARQIHAHAAEYRQKLEAFETEADYEMLSGYYSRNWLFEEKSLRDFETVSDMAGQYVRILDGIYYLIGQSRSYLSQGELLQRVANSTAGFYDNLAMRDREYRKDHFTEQHLKAMEDMEEKIGMLLKAYCGLTEEDVSRIPEMDSQSLMVLIGRRMGVYE